MSSIIEIGSTVWLPDDEDMFLPGKVTSIDVDDVQTEFLQWGKQQKWFGSVRFNVQLERPKGEAVNKVYKILKDQMSMLLNSDGMYLCDGQTLLQHWGYADIYRWGGSNRKFSSQMYDKELESTFDLRFHTKQGEIISNYLLETIEAIMAST